jgi:hypothetical protein
MAKTFEGGCACGAVRYTIAAEPMMAGHCHCRDCQRMSGTGHSSLMMFPKAAATIKGPLKFHESTADSGNKVGRGFCANCGSFVTGRSSGFPDMVTIAAGSLDDPSRFQPQFIVYTARAHAWDRMDPALASFERMPPTQR